MSGMKKPDEEIRKQARFCRDLMDKLNVRIGNADFAQFRSGYTSMRSDIVRLRRELKELSDMLYPDYFL